MRSPGADSCGGGGDVVGGGSGRGDNRGSGVMVMVMVMVEVKVKILVMVSTIIAMELTIMMLTYVCRYHLALAVLSSMHC